jgi:hypothetical protein
MAAVGPGWQHAPAGRAAGAAGAAAGGASRAGWCVNRCVYIHQRLAIEGGARGAMIELLRTRWAPHLERRSGVRLFGVWATVGSTGEWPEVRVQWELDDWDHFARAQATHVPMEERDVYLAELWAQALDHRRSGQSTLLEPAPWSPDLAALRAAAADGRAPEVVLHEDVRSRPGQLAAYHDALGSEGVPLLEARGLRLLGAYRHALVPNLGINLWALDGWDRWQALMEAEPDDAELQAWTDRQGTWLVDLDGFLVAPPPEQALRT